MRKGGTLHRSFTQSGQKGGGEGNLAADGRFVGTAFQRTLSCWAECKSQIRKKIAGLEKVSHKERKEKNVSSKEEMNDQEAAQ